MDKLLNAVMDIGEQMLVCGGEVHRVEDSLQRIFSAYGTERADIFIITSSMVVTIQKEGNTYTQTRRITETATDYDKLHKLNELSRSICKHKFSAEEVQKRLSDISAGKKYPLWLDFLCYAVIAGAFTLFFGGNVTDAFVSFIAGAFVRLVILVCDKTVKNKIFSKFISSAVATSIAFSALNLTLITSVDKIIIGNIMTLIPGIGLTTALKDLLVGDSIAGLLRTIEACITALAIAVGYLVITFLVGGAI